MIEFLGAYTPQGMGHMVLHENRKIARRKNLKITQRGNPGIVQQDT